MGQTPVNRQTSDELEELNNALEQVETPPYGDVLSFLKEHGMTNTEDLHEFVQHCGKVFAEIEQITKQGPTREIMREVQVREINTLHNIATNRETSLANVAVETRHKWDPNPHDAGFDFYTNGVLVHYPHLEDDTSMSIRLQTALQSAQRFLQDVEQRGVESTFLSIERYFSENPNASDGMDTNRIRGLLNVELKRLLATHTDLQNIPETQRDYQFYEHLIQASLPTIHYQLVEQKDPCYIHERALTVVENQAQKALAEQDLEDDFNTLSYFLNPTSNAIKVDNISAREPTIQKLGIPGFIYDSSIKAITYYGKMLSENPDNARINLAYILLGENPPLP